MAKSPTDAAETIRLGLEELNRIISEQGTTEALRLLNQTNDFDPLKGAAKDFGKDIVIECGQAKLSGISVAPRDNLRRHSEDFTYTDRAEQRLADKGPYAPSF